MTEEERHRQILAARSKALAIELQALEEVCGELSERAAEAGCAAQDLGVELGRLPPEASDG